MWAALRAPGARGDHMQQLALAFDFKPAARPRPSRRRGLRLEGRPVRRRDLKPENPPGPELPLGYRPAYLEALAAAMAQPPGPRRIRALRALPTVPFDAEEDRRSEALEMSWGALSHRGRADQCAE